MKKCRFSVVKVRFYLVGITISPPSLKTRYDYFSYFHYRKTVNSSLPNHIIVFHIIPEQLFIKRIIDYLILDKPPSTAISAA